MTEAIKEIEEETKLPGARRLFSAVLAYFYAVAGQEGRGPHYTSTIEVSFSSRV